MTKFTPRKGQHKAEILWALKCVMSHFLIQLTNWYYRYLQGYVSR